MKIRAHEKMVTFELLFIIAEAVTGSPDSAKVRLNKLEEVVHEKKWQTDQHVPEGAPGKSIMDIILKE